MKILIDSTVLFHLNYHKAKMLGIIDKLGITSYFISRISYIEILAGASENTKADTRKFLQQFNIMEFDAGAVKIASMLAMKYRVGKTNSKDFLIAATCIANKLPILTENGKDFGYKELKLINYKISNFWN